MRETIHQIATTGIDIFVLILLAIGIIFVLVYVGYFVFETMFLLFGGGRKKP
jgi:hypothetical protein